MSRQIVILAAGKGTRMGSSVPKVLVPLHGQPIIEHVLERANRVPGCKTPIIVVGYGHEQVKQALGPNYIYAFQEQQLGTASAVQAAQAYVTADQILILNGDMPYVSTTSMINLFELHEANRGPISMFTTTVPNFEGVYSSFSSFGKIIRNSDNAIIKITEFKDATDEERKIREVNLAEYVFSTEWLWPSLKRVDTNNAQKEYYLTDLVEFAIQDGLVVQGLSVDPMEAIGINTSDHLEQAHNVKPE
jgi:bifunctional UDP-N-acetylglucosamine pyrophosphorylase / glucosamine-1-phosphate N-acetyltransferase